MTDLNIEPLRTIFASKRRQLNGAGVSCWRQSFISIPLFYIGFVL